MNKEILSYALLIGITMFTAIILSLVTRKLLSLFIKKYSKRLRTDPTNFSFLRNSVGFIIYVIAIIFIFLKTPYLKSIGTALFAGAGIIAVIVGLASQKAFANIISGIFILIFKPFRIFDIIEFKDGQKGTVEEITLRHTVINNNENRRIIIPNSIISEETIINSSFQDEKIRKHVTFSISYDSNINKAIEIIRQEALNHPLTLDNRSIEEKEENESIVTVRVISLSDYFIAIKAFVWTKGNKEALILESDLLKAVKEQFDKNNIEIPFPYRTIIYKKDIDNAKKSSK